MQKRSLFYLFCILSCFAMATTLSSCGDTSSEGGLEADESNGTATDGAVCGDGVCFASEKRAGSCDEDCPVGATVCGNGTCSGGETVANCPLDCDGTEFTHSCGDNTCFIDELAGGASACPGDCPDGVTVCGNGQCGDGETFATCPDDCEDLGPVSNGTSNGAVSCDYPAAPANVQAGGIMPPLSWEGAYKGDGSQVNFDLRDFHCNDETWGQFTSILFVVGTGWCPACPDYIQLVAGQSSDLESEGMLVVFVEAEDRNSVPSSNRKANDFITGLIGDATSLRVGDGDTMQGERTIYNSPIITGFPSAWVVRRADMQIIADQGSSQFVLPFIDIARDPTAEEWVSTGGGGGGPPSNCGSEDEEPFEPNDTPMDASAIEPGVYEGGVCSPGADFYEINIEGTWRLDLEFDHAVGDLDVHIWDNEENAADRDSGSYSTTDNESFEHTGPATIMIYGYGLATAPYILNLTAF